MSNPKVWARFTVTRKSDQSVLNLCIQELSETQHDDFSNFIEKYFITSETFQKASGIYKSEDAKKEFREVFVSMFRDPKFHAVICCSDNDADTTTKPILGISMMSKEGKDDYNKLKELASLFTTPEMKKLFGILSATYELCDATKMLDYEEYYSGRGLLVHPDYRGLGIASELVRIRRVISKEHGVAATGAWMTSIGSQKAAERNNWQTLMEIPFEEFGKQCGATFDGAPPMCKLQYAGDLL